MYVHTNYCTTEVVEDVVNEFGGRIVSAQITREEDEHSFDCVDVHGECFEILIDFCADRPTCSEPDALKRYSRNDGPMWSQDHFITDSNRHIPYFDADFTRTTSKHHSETVPEELR